MVIVIELVVGCCGFAHVFLQRRHNRSASTSGERRRRIERRKRDERRDMEKLGIREDGRYIYEKGHQRGEKRGEERWRERERQRERSQREAQNSWDCVRRMHAFLDLTIVHTIGPPPIPCDLTTLSEKQSFQPTVTAMIWIERQRPPTAKCNLSMTIQASIDQPQLLCHANSMVKKSVDSQFLRCACVCM
jgi:hypothetical protein